MKPTYMNTLVIAPYTKRFGIAVFGRVELLHFSVHQYKSIRNRIGRPSPDEFEIAELIDDFKPNKVLLKSLTIRQANSPVQQNFFREIKRTAATESIPVEEVDFDGVTSTVVGWQKLTHRQLFTKLADTFPELTRLTKFQNPAQEEYYKPVLSAIAIGASSVNSHPTFP